MLIVFGLLVNSCRKESEIANELEPGKQAGISAYRILSVLHIAEELALQRNDQFFTSQTRLIKTDSIYTDGDGIKYILDFGNGVVCSDGILRKGICRLLLTDTLFPIKGDVELSASSADGFAIQAKSGWEAISGTLLLKKYNADSANVEFKLEFSSKTKSLDYISSTINNIKIRYHQPMYNSKNGEDWNGNWNVSGSSNSKIFSIMVTASRLSNHGQCRSQWNTGKITAKSLSSDPIVFDLNVDPFGNGACDQVFKVSKGAKLSKDEMTFDAW